MSAPVTVAIVSWNTRDLLARCLESLQEDSRSEVAEVWVVDNASEDGSAELVDSAFPWVRLIASSDNLGFGRAVNEVARRTSGEWIAAANADVGVTPGALGAMLAIGSDPSSGAVAPRLVLPDGGTQHSVHAFPTLALAIVFNLGLQHVVPGLGDRLCLEGYWDPGRERYVPWAHGAFLLLRRRALEAVGGFDPEQWLYAEDIDVQWRLARSGWRTRYVPTARVNHTMGAATSQAFGAQRTARHLAATYAWLVRRRGLVVTWACAAMNAGGAAIRAVILSPAALVAPRRFQKGRQRARLFARLHARGLRGRRALIQAAPLAGGR